MLLASNNEKQCADMVAVSNLMRSNDVRMVFVLGVFLGVYCDLL